VGGDIRTSSESKEVKWIEGEKLFELNVHPSIKLRITHAQAGDMKVYFS